MKKIILSIILALSLSGCGLEIWEGRVYAFGSSVYTEDGKTLYSTIKFTEKGCKLAVQSAYYRLSKKNMRPRPWGFKCHLTNYFGF